MVWSNGHSPSGAVWRLAGRQHGVISREQLQELGYSRRAVEHRIKRGRLYVVRRGVYAVGRSQLTREGRWMAAVLSCGPDAVVSHHDAGALWKIRAYRGPLIHLSVPHCCRSRGPGLAVHRRSALGPKDVTRRNGIPVTTPITTLIDMAPDLTERQLERAINEADMLGLVRPEPLRAALDGRRQPGVAKLSRLLDRHMFVMTESELEQAFLPLVRAAGLPPPQTRQVVNRFKVDFFWPDLGLVVETDSWTHHRTPAQQDRDRRRDHAHFAAELIPLRFTHGQIAHDPKYVIATLRKVARRAAH